MSKRINTSYVSDPSIQQPFTTKSLDFLQDGILEITNGIIKNMIQNRGFTYSASVPYLVAKGTGAYDRYYFFDGELYRALGLNSNLYAHIDTSADATADPLLFSDNVNRDVHNNRYLTINATAAGSLFALADVVDISPPTLHYSQNFCNGTNHIGVTSFIANFNNTIVDPAGYYNTTNGKIQPTTSGTYEITYKAILKENGGFANCWGNTQINKNGVLSGYFLDRKNVTTSTDWVTFGGSMIVEANGTTDYFEIYVGFTSACNLDLYGGVTVRKLK
jgi:hypothetical protein